MTSSLSYKPSLTPEEILETVLKILDEGQADQVITIDLRKKTNLADYMIIASGRSTRHVAALAQNIEQSLKPVLEHKPVLEGMTQCDWVLVDAGDVIVHLFRPEIRTIYDLEKIWL